MSAWQWCVGVGTTKHLSHPRTLCCRQGQGVDASVDAGGRESSGGGDLGFDIGGGTFAGPDGTGRPLSCSGSAISPDSEC